MENPGGYNSVNNFDQDVEFSSKRAARHESMDPTTPPFLLEAGCLWLNNFKFRQ